jgi:hypothetical protein
MTNSAINSLLETGVINEDTKLAITEAWESQLAEARETVRAELREEFARRYEHDKNTMVVALDKIVTESLQAEISEFQAEKQALTEDRVKFQKFVRESGNKFQGFMVEKLAEEIKVFREDRKLHTEGAKKLEKFVMEQLAVEIQDFTADKKQLSADKAKFQRYVSESSKKINSFIATQLATEMTELKQDRKVQMESVQKLEKFVMQQLSEEVQEFARDKQAIVETKIKLVNTAKEKLAEMQQSFITRSAQLVKESVTQSLESELTQLKEDIQVARENMFGRRLFEAFAGEFTATHLNENKEIAKLTSLVKAKNRQLAEAKSKVTKASKLVESKDREMKIIQESTQRKQVIAELLNPLSKDKAGVMSDLLENVQTNKLRSVYDKYLPSVLGNTKQSSHVTSFTAKPTVMLAESRKEVTGDKTAKPNVQYDSDNVIEIKRLAGLK